MTRTEAYYAVLTHECIHWSGAKQRLDHAFGKRRRHLCGRRTGAEIGSVFLCAELGIMQGTRKDPAQYFTHLLKLLKSDNRVIFTAAAKASEQSRFPGGQPTGSPPAGRSRAWRLRHHQRLRGTRVLGDVRIVAGASRAGLGHPRGDRFTREEDHEMPFKFRHEGRAGDRAAGEAAAWHASAVLVCLAALLRCTSMSMPTPTRSELPPAR
jgi:Zincin-like metallopeptidase